jgi:hypothetical protein
MSFINSCDKSTVQPIKNVETCLDSDLADGLLLYYKFNDGSLLNSAQDLFHLQKTPNVKVTSGRNNSPNCAFEFDGTNDNYLFCDVNPNLSDSLNNIFINNDYTVSFWYYGYTPRDGGDIEFVFSNYNKDLINFVDNGVFLSMHDLRRPNMYIGQNSIWDDSDKHNITFGQLIEFYSNKWNYYTFTKSSDTMKFYFNGILNNTTKLNLDVKSIIPITKLYFGQKLNGKLDDFMLHNRILSDTEIKRLYESQPCCDGTSEF